MIWSVTITEHWATEGVVTHPEIRRTSVEIELQGLGRGADVDLAQILGVVLLVLGSNLTTLAVGVSLDKLGLAADTTASSDIGVGKATLGDGCGVLVWARLGGLEAETVHEVDW